MDGRVWRFTLILFLLPGTGRGGSLPSYRDYEERMMPKHEERRRVAVATEVDAEAAERGSYDVRLLQALLLARLSEDPGIELVPRAFGNAGPSLLAQVQALEVDDLIRIRLTQLQVPRSADVRRAGDGVRRYRIQGNVEVLAACTGQELATGKLEAAPLPDLDAFADPYDAQAFSLAALVRFVAALHEESKPAAKLAARCSAAEAAERAEREARFADAALILDEVMRRDPVQATALRERRDLAAMRARKQGLSVPLADEQVGTLPRGGVDLLAPSQRGKLVTVTQANVPVRESLPDAFAVSAGVLLREPDSHGGILVNSRTKNIYIGISPGSGSTRPRITIESLNLVTRISDSRKYELPPDAVQVGKLARLEVRHDHGEMAILLDGKRTFAVPGIVLENPAVLLFAKLSTVQFLDVKLWKIQ